MKYLTAITMLCFLKKKNIIKKKSLLSNQSSPNGGIHLEKLILEVALTQ